MYYLFIYKQKDLDKYKLEFERVKCNREKGITPVVSEIRNAKTMLAESLPYNILNGILLVLGTLVLSSIHIPEILKIAIVLIVNNFFGVLSNYIFVNIKHILRKNLCKRLKIEPSESNIAVMESLEYQSV